MRFGWIISEVEKGTSLERIIVTNITPKGGPVHVIKLDQISWKRLFLEIYNTFYGYGDMDTNLVVVKAKKCGQVSHGIAQGLVSIPHSDRRSKRPISDAI